MKDILLTIGFYIVCIIVLIELLHSIDFIKDYIKHKNKLTLLMMIFTIDLFYDVLVILLGSILKDNQLIKILSQIKYILHGLTAPLLLQICAYCLKFKDNEIKLTWLFTSLLMIFGFIAGIIVKLELINLGNIYLYTTATNDFVSKYLNLIGEIMIIPLVITGFRIWNKEKNISLFLASIFMIIFILLGPLTNNHDFSFLFIMIGEAIMLTFFNKYLAVYNNDEKVISPELIRAVKFTLFSISAGLIEILSFTLLNELIHLPYWLSYLIALVLSVLWNFTLNRNFTFKSAANVKIAMLKVFCFYLVFTPASTILEHYLTSVGLNEYLVTLINMVLNFILEFLYQRYYVFKDSIDTKK